MANNKLYENGNNSQDSTAMRETTPMSAKEVQDAVQAGSEAATAQIPSLRSQANAEAAAALDTSGLNISGMGRNGSGSWYNLIGPGGVISPEMQGAFLASAPGSYKSPYTPAMETLMNQLLNPGQFKYDVNADGLYQQIKDNYVKKGRQAMMDTQGQSAALTGGFGNSYGTMAGQQAYQESLGNLAGMIPELQQLAYQQYLNDQDAKRNNLEALNKMNEQEFARWQDEQAAYQELLKTLPEMGMMGVEPGSGNWSPDMSGIFSVMNKAYGSGNNQLDPTTWANTIEGISSGKLSALGIMQGIEDGQTWKGMDTNTMYQAALYSMNPENWNMKVSLDQQYARRPSANHGKKTTTTTNTQGKNGNTYNSAQQLKDLGH